jgi:hypothetical protein
MRDMKPRRHSILLVILLAFGGIPFAQPAAAQGNLKRIYFNLYTDSIKTILNFYVNVEGEYTNGRVLPMDANTITIVADHGTMSGVEWVPPQNIDFEKVTFHAIAKEDAKINDRITVWLKRAKDPRDEMDLPAEPGHIRKRRR